MNSPLSFNSFNKLKSEIEKEAYNIAFPSPSNHIFISKQSAGVFAVKVWNNLAEGHSVVPSGTSSSLSLAIQDQIIEMVEKKFVVFKESVFSCMANQSE